MLWVGCADSRVPAEYITNSQPGDLFVHRNIANLTVESDLSFMSVLQYAVIVLKVKHVVVCGHHGCGGVRASMAPASPDLFHVNRHLEPIKQTYHQHAGDIDTLPDADSQVNRLVELNVMEQVQNLAKNSVIQYAWLTSEWPVIHGLVYDMSTGKLKQIAKIDNFKDIEQPSVTISTTP